MTLSARATEQLRDLGPLWWHWDLRRDTWLHSPGLSELLGLAASDRLDRGDWMSKVAPDDVASVERGYAALAVGTLARWQGSYRAHHAQGHCVEIEDRAILLRDAAGPLHVFGSVTLAGAPGREHPPAAALDADDFRTFVDWIPQLAWTAQPDGWIDFYNRRWYDYTGTTFDAMQGWGWVSVHDPDDLPRVLRVFRNALATGEAWEDEFRLRRASDGMLRWHLSRMLPVRDEHNRVRRWFGTNTDIHDQKLAAADHARLLAAEHRARQDAEAASLAKDQFLAVVSHELRTPLNAMLGWAQLLASQPTLDWPRVRAGVEKIERNALAQATMIEDLLDTSRIISGNLDIEMRDIFVNDAAIAAIENVRTEADRRGIRIHWVPDGESPTVLGDAGRLGQVFVNLIANAVKFSADGQDVAVVLESDATIVRLSVVDRGVGIDAEKIPHVFERFWQADRSSTRRHGGLGLGLAIARQLVQLHGGEIVVSSPGLGMGSTFCVVLPKPSDDAERLPARASTRVDDTPVSLEGIRVLAVDDEPNAREILATVLVSCGATTTAVPSVAHALRAFNNETFDVIVSDIAMPDVDGFGLVAAVRALSEAKGGTIPIIALTAHGSLEDRRRALAAGFDMHLAKPIRAAVLSRAVLDLVRRRAC